jgi:hypothetical protein
MARPGRTEIPSNFVGTMTDARTEHVPPSVQQHIEPRRVVPNAIAALFVAIVRPKQNAHASLPKDRMRRFQGDLITQDIST